MGASCQDLKNFKAQTINESNYEIEKEFKKDSYEKKVISRSAAHRASRRKGFHGGVKFHVDYLRGKERKNYIMTKEICNISAENITYEQFKSLNFDNQLFCLTFLFKKYGVSYKRIALILNTTERKIYQYVRNNFKNKIPNFKVFASKEYVDARKEIFQKFLEEKTNPNVDEKYKPIEEFIKKEEEKVMEKSNETVVNPSTKNSYEEKMLEEKMLSASKDIVTEYLVNKFINNNLREFLNNIK